MKHNVALIPVVVAAMALLVSFGCRSTKVQPWYEYADTITLAGIYADLNRGDYAGFMTVSNLLRYGDFGLGTYHGLDGEMVIYSGEVYRVDSRLLAAPVSPSISTPFAVVSFFSPDRMFDVARMNQVLFKRAIALRRKNDRLPQAIHVQGLFKTIHIRSVAPQEPPWKPLSDALAADSNSITLSNVVGRMVGYYIPASFEPLHPEGYHFHFLRDDRITGGHVLDFDITQARIELDNSPRLHVLVNTNAPATKRSNRLP